MKQGIYLTETRKIILDAYNIKIKGLKPEQMAELEKAILAKTSAAGESIANKFLERLPTLLSQKPKSVVLWANHDILRGDELRIRKAIPKRMAMVG